MTIVVTKMADYGLYPGDRGHQATLQIRPCDYSARGGGNFGESLRTTYDEPPELTYAAWVANLVANGVNIIRVKFGAHNRDWEEVLGFEPPPYGTYNIGHSVLNDYIPGNLATYRTHQVSEWPVDPSSYWANSVIKGLFDALAGTGVKIWPILFEHREFQGSDWEHHAWNADNEYIEETECEVQDQGFLTNAYDFWTDATAIAQAKARIDFILDMVSGYNVIAGWSLFAEIPWCMTMEFWGDVDWATARTNIRTKTIPWVKEIGGYLRDNDPYKLPIGLAHARTDGSGTWSGDPDNYWNVMNEPFQVYPIDVVEYNIYEDGNINDAITHVKMLREKHPHRVLWCTQYWPFDGSLDDVEEEAPYLDSKEHQWIAACASWGLGPLRWPGFLRDNQVWKSGNPGDTNYNAVGGVTETFASYVRTDWNLWEHIGEDWDADIGVGGAGLDREMSWGCPNRVIFYLNFTAGGVKTVTIDGINNGDWTVYLFDWEDGTLDATLTPTAAGNSLSFDKDVSGFSRYILVGYAKQD